MDFLRPAICPALCDEISAVDFVVLFHRQISELMLLFLQRFKPLDYVLFGDSDLMPLHAATYQTDRNWQRQMHIINAFCCDTINGKRDKNPVIDADDTDILHLAMCHAGASVSTWNQIFAMDVSEKWDTKGLEQYMRNIFKKGGSTINWCNFLRFFCAMTLNLILLV